MRAARMLVAGIVAVVLVVPATAAPRHDHAGLSRLEAGVLVDINAFRRAHRLPPLKLNDELGAAARAHTVQMAARGYFAHESADGSVFWKRIETFYRSSPWRFWSVGENLLWSSPDVSPAAAMRIWLASPPHRANLMDQRWREIGLSAVHVAGAPGIYKGRDVTIVTTDFGVRR